MSQPAKEKQGYERRGYGGLYRNSNKKYTIKVDAGKIDDQAPLNDVEAKKPDWTGQLFIDGEEFRVAGWWKDNEKQKQRYLSLNVESKIQPEAEA